MPALTLAPHHRAVKTYYQDLHQLDLLYHSSEGGVSPAFATLLRHCAHQCHWTLAEQYPLKRGQRTIYPDGALLDTFRLVHGWWEAKDTGDDLAQEVRKKFDQGYPQNNILFQAPERAILWRDGHRLCDEDISPTHPGRLVHVLKEFFAYEPPEAYPIVKTKKSDN